MGWNAGYTIFESTVIGAYDLGKLDKEMLAVLMEPYRHSDIDSGGSRGMKSHDGKDVERLVIETWGLAMPDAPIGDDDAAWDDYGDDIYEKFREVTENFGW